MTQEEEDEKYEDFKKIGEEKTFTLTEYLQMQQRGDDMLQMFYEGYSSGILINQFKDLTLQEQIVHMEVLQMYMIISRKEGDMEKYEELKEIIERINKTLQ